MTPASADFVRLAVVAQTPLAGFGVVIDRIDDGSVTLSFPVSDALCTAGTGVVMGGIVATVADVAAGVSILTRLDPPRPVTTLSLSSQQIGPARGDRIICRGQVERVGRHVALTGAEVFAVTGEDRRLCARLSATFALA